MAVLAWLYADNRRDLAELSSRDPEWRYLGLAFAAAALGAVAAVLRWWLLVRSRGFDFPLREALRLSFVGQLSVYLAPGATGDVVRAVLIARGRPSGRTAAVMTIVLDRGLGLLGLFWAGALAGAVGLTASDHSVFRLLAWGCGASGLAGTALLFAPLACPAAWRTRLVPGPAAGRAVRLAGDAVAALSSYRGCELAAAILIGMVGHVLLAASFFGIAHGLRYGQIAPGLAGHVVFVSSAQLIAVVAPTPGGLGVMEGAARHAYGRADRSSSEAEAEIAAAAGLVAAAVFRLFLLGVAVGGVAAVAVAEPFRPRRSRSSGGRPEAIAATPPGGPKKTAVGSGPAGPTGSTTRSERTAA